MEFFHLNLCLVCVLVTTVQAHSMDTYNHDLKQRLSELETTVLRFVERNNDLVERNNDLAERNNDLVDRNKNLAERNNRLEDRNNNIEIRNSHLTEKNDNLEKRVSALETEINEFRDVPQKKETIFKRQSGTIETVAFTAVVHQNDLHNLGAGQTIIYDKVITNVGSAYHNHTGIFIAPFNGVYVFNFAEMIYAGQDEYLELVKNGQHVMWNYGHALGATHVTSSSRTSTIELKAGDEVWIRTSPYGNHGTGEIHGNDYTTFSGWIVYIA